jgi:glycosyltransferase involved in cell wall biosynthesis
MKISILLPSRGRPKAAAECIRSAIDTADEPDGMETVLRMDEDDNAGAYRDACFRLPHIVPMARPRALMSNNWNDAWVNATGEILMHCGDDIRFRTQGWDTMVRAAFEAYPDRIVFVHGDDGSEVWKERFGTHGFIHQRWAKAVGYFVPPHFSADWNDTWLNDVANSLGRRVYIPAMVTEHMHWSFGKGPKDETATDIVRRAGSDGNEGKYQAMGPMRAVDVEKLRALLGTTE